MCSTQGGITNCHPTLPCALGLQQEVQLRWAKTLATLAFRRWSAIGQQVLDGAALDRGHWTLHVGWKRGRTSELALTASGRPMRG